MSDPVPAAPHRKRLLTAALIAGALLSFGAGAVASVAAPEAAGAMHHGMRHGGMRMMAGHLDKLLDEAGASADQKTRIHANMERAFASMKPVHERMGDTHKQIHDILAAPTVDRGALERLRVQRIADIDQASRVMTTALADSADVLTPDQRAKLAAAVAAHHAERHDKH